MKEIWRSYIYQGKNMFRDFGFTFWGLLYPVILGTFFYITFSGLTNPKIEEINVGLEKGSQISSILESIDILNVIEISDADVEIKLEEGEIDGYIEEDLSLLTNKSEFDQTIIKGILDQVKQTLALNLPIEDFEFDVDYLKETSQEADGILIIFYSLIAMVSTYGVFPGIETGVISQANLSNVSARINVTPIKKSTILISGIGVGLTLNLVSNIILLLSLQFIMDLDLISNIGYTSIFILLGNLFGISLGIFIGVSNKKSTGVKTMLAIISTMFMSFLAGLISPNIKILVDKNFPILSKINPIGVVTNNLYKINLLDNKSNLGEGILILLASSTILIVASYVFLRRRQYDSL